MPRLSNEHPFVEEWFGHKFNHDNPGDTGPVDVCLDCARLIQSEWASSPVFDGEAIEEYEHPPFEDTDYVCDECGAELTSADNWTEE
jgi:hypothetical protein